MNIPRTIQLRLAAVATAVALTAAGLAFVPSAAADTLPANPASPASPVTAAADALPTVQHNGVAWAQVVVGNTVYVVGKFTQARPAGSAAGVNAVTRNNILAYNIETGALITSFAPSLNAQALAIAASPDGSRIYVTGDFTTVDGASYYRIAAFSTATGQVIPSFKPILGSQGRAVIASNTTVYVGGTFRTVSSQPRDYVASINASNGAVNAWAPNADATVNALALTTDNSKLIVGGRFTTLAGTALRGLGAVNASTGASMPFAANSVVRNAGTEASITSLIATPDRIYGTGYVFGSGGNLEGTFSADPATGNLIWLEDCHGDTYSSFPQGDVVYVASHAHYCGNIGGFPQTEPWTMYYATAFSKAATGTVKRDPMGYFNFEGRPAPTLLDWFPKLQQGTYTGQGQAGWSVSGNSRYVVYAGEFTHVNGQPQYGLVRFANPSIAPNKVAPIVNEPLVPTVASVKRGEVRLTWTATYDYDNANLTYRLVRDGQTATPIYTKNQYSNFYTRARMGFIDKGLVPGSTHTYRLYVSDGYGNTISRLAPTATVSTTDTGGAYSDSVLESEPSSYWPLGESSGTSAFDSAGFNDITLGAGTTRGSTGIISGTTATTFSGGSTGFGPTPADEEAPDTFTVETWIKTTTTSGGKIIGFGNSATGNSGNYDRHVYMDNAGRIWFGVHPGGVRTVNSAAAFNDGQWHQVTASLGSNGMVLYVDGKIVGSRTDVTSGQPFTGRWRIGGDNLGGWTNQPSSNYFAGDIAQVSIYPTVLSRPEIVGHYVASGRESSLPTAPADEYGAAVFNDNPQLYWRLSENSGGVANDSGPNDNDGEWYGPVRRGVPGVVSGNLAAFFGEGETVVASENSFANPTVYSVETWFKTTTTRGGKLIGFGNNRFDLSNNYDRHLYMQDDGKLVFGTYTGATNTATSPEAYNDGEWHHAVATQSSAGITLYVDGAVVGTNPATGAQDYTGYWRVGGDTTWGSSTPYFEGDLDEAAVYGTALTQAQVTEHYNIGAEIEEPDPNIPPTADFTADVDHRTVSFEGSWADPDGAVALYTWDFGDGETASGPSPNHTYAIQGTYTVTFTVTDDDGATGSVTKTVTTKPNVAPVSQFTSSANELVVSFDGTGSSDPDGDIVGYSWSFGDGGLSTSATPTHTYTAPGTYSVSLAVEDDWGDITSLTKSVTVTSTPVVTEFVSDDFSRTVSPGWGTAPTGGAYTVSGGSANSLRVTGGYGEVTLIPSGTRTMTLSGVSRTASDSTISFTLDAVPTGGGAYTSIIGRQVGSNVYVANVWVKSTGAVVLVLKQGTTVLTTATVAGVTYTAGTPLSLRLQVTGTTPTTVKAKVWKTGQTEPTAWLATVTDSTAALQAPGSVAVQASLSASSTAGIVTRFDNFNARSPQ